MVLFRGSLGYDVGKTVTTQRGAVTPQVSSKPKAAGKAKQSRVMGSFFSCIQAHCPSFCSWSLVLKSEIMLILRPVHLNMSMQARNPPISMLLLMLVLVILLKCACESQNDLMFRHSLSIQHLTKLFFFSKSSYGCKVWKTFWSCLTLSSDASSLSSRELSLQDGYSCTP